MKEQHRVKELVDGIMLYTPEEKQQGVLKDLLSVVEFLELHQEDSGGELFWSLIEEYIKEYQT